MMIKIKPNGRVQAASQDPQSQRIETGGQEAYRGLELEAAQVMFISVVHKGTGVLQVGPSGLYWQTNP